MANKVLDWVWTHSRSRHSARLVMLSLADSTGRPGAWTWPSIPELMSRTGLGERAVQLATADLAAIGELEIQHNAGPGGCHRYKITMKTPGTPAESAGAQNLRGPKAGTTRRTRDAKKAQAKDRNPAESAGGAESAGAQNLRSDPADSAPGTQRTNPKNSSSKSSTEPAKHLVADELADAFWTVHKSHTAQTFLAIRGVVRHAIGTNGLKRDDVARALHLLATEGTAISGGSLTNAYARVTGTARQNGRGKYAPGSSPSDPLKPITEDTEVNL